MPLLALTGCDGEPTTAAAPPPHREAIGFSGPAYLTNEIEFRTDRIVATLAHLPTSGFGPAACDAFRSLGARRPYRDVILFPMYGPRWDNDAWQQIRDYEQFWTPFDERYRFRPGPDPAAWPAITEPAGSVTFDLGSVFGRADSSSADEDALNEQVLSAMNAVFSADAPLVALDWQHTCYWFWPHRQATEGQSWRVSAFPGGDYHALITQDLEQGTFGNPWEQTICVFGSDLTEVLVPEFALWLPEKRRNRLPHLPGS